MEKRAKNTNKFKSFDRDVLLHTLDELILLGLIILTCGLAFFLAGKRDTDKSIIHSFFKHIDFFTPLP